MKKSIAIILLLITTFLYGCSTMGHLSSEATKAYELSEKFCFSLAFDDIEKANGYLHPDWESNNGALEDYVKQFEQANGIDFSNGVAIKTRFSENIIVYDSRYNGNVYTMGIKMIIGNKELKLYFRVIDNDIGYGLYDFGLYSERPD